MKKLLCILGGLGLGFLWLQKPRYRYRKQVLPFTKVDYAHRGLHDEKMPENTKAALKAAVDHGYGIEMDVRRCKDGLVIHHDQDFLRSAKINRRVEECTLEELSQIKVFDSEETISSLEEILEVIDGRIPLLLEIKAEGDFFAVASEVQAVMDQYTGDYLIESFRPEILLWYRRYRPEVLRGQLSEPKMEGPVCRRWMMGLYLVNALSRPDFLAYNKAGSFWVKFWNKLGVPTFVYTLREPSQQKEYFDAGIFEGYLAKRTVNTKA